MELLDIVLRVSEWTSAAGEYNRHKKSENALWSYVLKQYWGHKLYSILDSNHSRPKSEIRSCSEGFLHWKRKGTATYQIEGNQLKVATPQGTIYEQELTYSIEKEPDEAVESIRRNNNRSSQWIPKIIWETRLCTLLRNFHFCFLDVLFGDCTEFLRP